MPRYYVLFLLIVFSSSVYGLPQLIISPNQGTSEVYMGYKQPYNISLYNNGTTSLYNLTFEISSDSDYFQFPIITNISANATYLTNISITTNSVFEKSYVAKLQYKYYTEDTYEGKNYVINITSLGYQPSYYTIKRTDNITFVNLDISNHTVKEVSNGFNYLIEPGMNVTHTFSSIGEIVYYDSGYTGLIGKVNVSQEVNNVLVHTPNLDSYWILGVKSKYATSDYSVNLLRKDIDMEQNDARENVIEITNNRTFELYGVKLTTEEPYQDWITYTTNNINISGLTSKLINIVITPKLNKTTETNKTHEIPITITPLNANPTTIQLDVFVKYHNFGNIDLGNATIQINELGVDETIALCLARPDYGNCEKLLYFCAVYPDFGKCKEIYKERIIEVPAQYNVSGDRIEKMISSTEQMDELWQRQDNKYNTIQQDLATVATKQAEIDISYKSLIQKQLDYEKQLEESKLQEKRANILRWVLGILFSLVVGIFILLKFLAWHGTHFQQIRQSPGE